MVLHFPTLINFIKDVFWRQILFTVPAPSDNDIYTLIKGTPRYIFWICFLDTEFVLDEYVLTNKRCDV